MLTSDLSTLFVRGQLAAVREAGFEVHLATNWHSDERPVDRGVTTWQIPFEREPSLGADLRSLKACIALLRRLRPDIIHAGTPKAGLIGMLSSWLMRVPTRIYALHGLRYETARGLARAMYKTSERVSCAFATVVVSDSESMRARCIDDRLVRQRKIVVLGYGSANGVDIERFTPSTSGEDERSQLGVSHFRVIIGFVGRMTRDKGVDDLVSVFLERFGGRTDVGLLLAGPIEPSDPIAPWTETAISSSDQIVHFAWLEDTADVYRAMDVLAFPSYREGLPNVPLEAQSSGVPVVGYAATGTIDVADPTLLVPVGDTKALGDLLEAVVGDMAGWAQRSTDTRSRTIERFDQRAVWAERIKLFRSSTGSS